MKPDLAVLFTVLSVAISSAGVTEWSWDIDYPAPTYQNLEAACVSPKGVAFVISRSQMFRSMDLGKSWNNITPTDLAQIEVACPAENVVIAFGDAHPILRTTDGGLNWTRSTRPDGSTFGSSQAMYGSSFADEKIGVAVGTIAGFRAEVIRTTDGGIKWSAISVNLSSKWLRGVAMNQEGIGIAVGENGAIARSTDKGLTWTEIPHGLTTGILRKVRFSNATIAVAVGDEGLILRSDDAGSTWERIAHGLTKAGLRNLAFSENSVGTAVGDSGVILRTTDGGASWTIIQGSKPNTTYQSIVFADSKAGLAVSAASRGILRTDDGGLTWNPARPDLGNSPLSSVRFTDSTCAVAVAVGSNGTILRTADGGSTWSKALQTETTTMDLKSLAFASSGVGISVGDSGTILRTIDGGSSWSPAPHPGAKHNLLSVAFATAAKGVAVGERGTLLRTADGGASWNLNSMGLTGVKLNSISFGDSSTGSIVGDAGVALYTKDGGDSWQSVPVIPTSKELYSVSLTTGGRGLATGDKTIFVTRDGGKSWSGYNAYPRPYTYIAIQPNGIGVVLASGFQNDGGFYGTKDYGSTWKKLSGDLFSSRSRAFAFGMPGIGGSLVVGDLGLIFRTQEFYPILGTPLLIDTPAEEMKAPSAPLRWLPVPWAAAYQIQVSLDLAFADIVTDFPVDLNSTNPEAPGKLVYPLKAGVMHYWRVRATDSAGPGPWSKTRTFTPGSTDGMYRNHPIGSNQLDLTPGHLRFALDAEAKVTLAVLDLAGRSRILFEGRKPKGIHEIQFDPRAFAGGRYILVFEAGKVSKNLMLSPL